MSKPLRIPLSDSVRVRLAGLYQQKAQIDRDVKLIADTVIGTQLAPHDPLWNGSVELTDTEICITPKDGV